MELIDIIILSNAQTDSLRKLTENAIKSLLNSENDNFIRFNILVLESSETQNYLFPYTKTIFPPKPFGYNKYMNMGIKMTQANYVCLCNNDLIFHPGWATSILNSFTDYPNLKSASPICSINHPPRGIFPNTGVHFGYEVRHEVAGWCLFLKREILKITGPLEERLKFWYSDNDYAKTLEKHGILHGLVSSAVVDHLESQTLATKPKNEQIMLTNAERYFFERKWGNRSYLSYLNYRRKQLFKSLL